MVVKVGRFSTASAQTLPRRRVEICSYRRPRVRLLKVLDVLKASRELKMETFSGRRRPDWQRKPGTKAAVAPRQKENIKIAVNSEGRRL